MIVRDGRVIAEGVTAPVGGPHAEIVALSAAGDDAVGATLYATLEPCCHHGRTPPCTEAIIRAGIRRVVLGARDLNPLVDGRGCRTQGGWCRGDHWVLLSECQALHAPFFHYITHQRPWVILKAAITLDGQIATQQGDSKWITSQAARTDVHRTRAQVDAVMVGGDTARIDDPQLTVRLSEGTNPLRVILDTRLSLPETAAWSGKGTMLLCRGWPKTGGSLCARRQ